MGRETAESFIIFAALFNFIQLISARGTLPLEMADFEPFETMTNCDLAACWKGMLKGGATRVFTLPCTGCATESDNLATPNACLCARWCYSQIVNDSEWKCYHKPMATPEHVSSMKTEVAELISTLHGALDEIKISLPSLATTSNLKIRQKTLLLTLLQFTLIQQVLTRGSCSMNYLHVSCSSEALT